MEKFWFDRSAKPLLNLESGQWRPVFCVDAPSSYVGLETGTGARVVVTPREEDEVARLTFAIFGFRLRLRLDVRRLSAATTAGDRGGRPPRSPNG